MELVELKGRNVLEEQRGMEAAVNQGGSYSPVTHALLDSSDAEDSFAVSREGDTLPDTVITAIGRGDVEKVIEWVDSIPSKQRECLINKCKHLFLGKRALHFACEHNHINIAKVLVEAGADPNVKDDSKDTALHYACENPDDEDIEELVKVLMERKCAVNSVDKYRRTALHYAAENGHTSAVVLLLEAGAKVDVRDESEDMPVHLAAMEGQAETLAEMIAHCPDCVHFEGEDNETPLHRAAFFGHVEAAEKLVENRATVNAVTSDGLTPLHKAVTNPSLRLVKLLLDAGAEVSPYTDSSDRPSPLRRACWRGHDEIVELLLEEGAEVDTRCLEDAIREGYEKIAMALLKSPQWPIVLRHTFETDEGKVTTPFRELIKKMPDAAEEVLNNCTIADPNDPDPSDSSYSVIFNYEFVEDFRDSPSKRGSNETDKGQRKKRRPGEKESYGTSYGDVWGNSKVNFATSWGPVGFKKANHPLAIMVESKNLKLLTHPLVGSLLHHKWKKFGLYGYLLDLFTYCLFLICLTLFALLVPNPLSAAIVGGSSVNRTEGESSSCGGLSVGTDETVKHVIILSAVVVVLSAFCRLLLKVAQLVVIRFHYLTKWSNWLETGLFTCSILFVWTFNTQCLCPYHWQWEIGAAAVFLAWIALMLLTSQLPLTGIYVLMFVRTFYTFFKMIFLTLLIVIAFSLTLYMAFAEPSITRGPFSHPGRSLLKTITMANGEYEFDAIFRQDPTGGFESIAEIPFPTISYTIWVAFIILMPILLTNMLVGLAVGDIRAIQDEAAVKKLSLQVDQVLAIEELLPRRLHRWFTSGKKEVYPNQRLSFLKRLQLNIWGGERYDTQNVLNRALRPPVDPVEELQEKSDTLLEEMEKMKKTMSNMEFLLQELAKKQGIISNRRHYYSIS